MRIFPSMSGRSRTTARHLFYSHDKDGCNTVIGIEVYDKNDQLIGEISDIYCDKLSLQSLYVEIRPFDSINGERYLYPFDFLNFFDEHIVFIRTDYASLKELKEFDRDYIFSRMDLNLVSYAEALNLSYMDRFFDYYNTA